MKLSVSLYEKGWQFSCHLITGRNVKNILLETVFPHIVLVRKKSASLYDKGWQFSCHIIAGRNIKDLSLENALLHIVLVRK